MNQKTLFLFALLILMVLPYSLHAQENKTVKGVLVLKKGYNKVGKVLPGDGDLYLQYNNKEVFVKVTSSGLSRDKLKRLLNKKRQFTIQENNGLLDTDDPNQQSRVGDYVVIIEARK